MFTEIIKKGTKIDYQKLYDELAELFEKKLKPIGLRHEIDKTYSWNRTFHRTNGVYVNDPALEGKFKFQNVDYEVNIGMRNFVINRVSIYDRVFKETIVRDIGIEIYKDVDVDALFKRIVGVLKGEEVLGYYDIIYRAGDYDRY